MKIRNKLTIQFAIIVASILILFSVAVYYLSASYRQQEFYSRLKDKAQTTAKLLIKVKEVDRNLLKIIDENTTPLYEEKVMIYNANNEVIYNSNDDDTTHLSVNLLNKIRLEDEVFFQQGETEVAGILYRDSDEQFVVVSSALDKYGISKLENLRLILGIGLFICVGLTILAGRFYSGQALKPISKVVNQVDKITVSNLDSRVDEGNATDEIAQLAITFNKMLERIEAAFEMQRSFVSNASHELRTPLTAITGQIEVTLMSRREDLEYESILNSILEDIRSLNTLTNGLLELAQVSLDIPEVKFKTMRIDELLWQMRTELAKRKSDYIINIRFDEQMDDDKKLTLLGNEQLLKTAIINLMDNACKFSNDKQVDINIGFNDKSVVLSFIDNGVGISSQDLNRVFEPFYRADNTRTVSGHGIGLSLAQKIINLHNGVISITSIVGKGTVVEVTLPPTA